MEINPTNFPFVFPALCDLLKTCEFFAIDIEMTGIFHAQSPITMPADAFKGQLKAARSHVPIQLGICIAHRAESLMGSWASGVASHEVRDMMAALVRPTGELDSVAAAALKERANEVTMQIGALREAAVATDDEAHVAVQRQLDLMTALEMERDLQKALSYLSHVSNSAMVSESNVAYTMRTFSCHLYPATPSQGEQGSRESFQMDVETVGNFLNVHGMDFNCWIRNGLRYAPTSTAASLTFCAGMEVKSYQLRSNLVAARDFRETARVGEVYNGKLMFLPDRDEYTYQMSELQAMGLSLSEGKLTFVDAMGCQNESTGFGAVRNLFGTRMFHALFRACRDYKKPIVLHNGLQDLLFLYCAAFSTELESLADFKRCISAMLPTLYDTNTLSSITELSAYGNLSCALPQVLKALKSKQSSVSFTSPTFEACGMADQGVAGRAHDAGHDARCTAELFAILKSELKRVGVNYQDYANLVPLFGSYVKVFLASEVPGNTIATRCHVPTTGKDVILLPPDWLGLLVTKVELVVSVTNQIMSQARDLGISICAAKIGSNNVFYIPENQESTIASLIQRRFQQARVQRLNLKEVVRDSEALMYFSS